MRKIPLQIKTLRSNFSGELSSINQDGKKTKVALIMHVLKSGKCGKSWRYEKRVQCSIKYLISLTPLLINRKLNCAWTFQNAYGLRLSMNIFNLKGIKLRKWQAIRNKSYITRLTIVSIVATTTPIIIHKRIWKHLDLLFQLTVCRRCCTIINNYSAVMHYCLNHHFEPEV